MSAVDRPIWLVVAALAVFDLVTAFFFFVKVFINLCLLLDFNLDSVSESLCILKFTNKPIKMGVTCILPFIFASS